MRHALWLALLISAASPVAADTIRIAADRDATLIEHPDGSLANGSGPFFFAGRTNQSDGSIRRALVRFDVAGSLPEGAVVESVSLTLFTSSSNSAPRILSLHRVLQDWSEGPSSASGGGGAPALAGDVTWIHTSRDTGFWRQPGGDFIGPESASIEVGETGSYTWADDGRLKADVLLWAFAPQRNFGWELIGDETAPQTSKSFASREHADPALRPALEITFRVPARSQE